MGRKDLLVIKSFQEGEIDLDAVLRKLGFGPKSKLWQRHFAAVYEVEQATLAEACAQLGIEIPEG